MPIPAFALLDRPPGCAAELRTLAFEYCVVAAVFERAIVEIIAAIVVVARAVLVDFVPGILWNKGELASSPSFLQY